MRTTRHLVEYVFFQVTSFLLSLLGLKQVQTIGGAVGSFAFALGLRRSVLDENLLHAFPSIGDKERDDLARAVTRNIAISLAELLWFSRMTVEDFKALVRFEEDNTLRSCAGMGKGVVVVTAHLGNWEILAQALFVVGGIPTHALYKPQSNKFIDRQIERRRTRFGIGLIPLGLAVRDVLRVLQSGGAVLVAADQSAPKESLRIPFFGREVPVFQGPAAFSLRTGAALVTAFALRQDDGSFVIKCKEIPTGGLKPDEEGIRELTRRHVEETEAAIRRTPEQWMWTHRRWKHVEGTDTVSEAS